MSPGRLGHVASLTPMYEYRLGGPLSRVTVGVVGVWCMCWCLCVVCSTVEGWQSSVVAVLGMLVASGVFFRWDMWW